VSVEEKSVKADLEKVVEDLENQVLLWKEKVYYEQLSVPEITNAVFERLSTMAKCVQACGVAL
jgi:hypothetical protein